MTSGQSTMDPTSPVWPPPSEPWQITMSTPAALWFSACLTEPASAATSIPWSWTCAMTSSGGVPSALATSLTLSWRRMTSTRGAAVAAVHPSSSRRGPPSSSGTPWSARIFLAKRAVLVGDHRLQLLLELHRVELTHALVLAGDHDVDPVRAVTDVLVEPVQLHLELLGAEPDRAEHADAAGVGDRRGHVAAVGEGEDREFDPETLAELVVHGTSSVSGVPQRPARSTN